MIYHLTGTIKLREDDFLVIDVNGVGYKVFVGCSKEESFKEKCTIFCYMQKTEKDIRLYGFQTKENLELFEKLTKMAGIGPKTALRIASIASVEELRRGISEDDQEIIKKIFTIGKKKGQQVIFELSEKFIKEAKEDVAFQTLKNLGFCDSKINEALKKVKDEKNDEERVAKALKILGR
jgi:holliday junction DNA helicase RuvA